MTRIFDTVETYSSDFKLFEKLGLKKFSIKNHTEELIGKVKLDNSWVELYVYGCPSQFFRAVIFNSEKNKKFEVKTGSGCLSDYWESFEKIATDMIVVKEVR